MRDIACPNICQCSIPQCEDKGMSVAAEDEDEVRLIDALMSRVFIIDFATSSYFPRATPNHTGSRSGLASVEGSSVKTIVKVLHQIHSRDHVRQESKTASY